MRALLCLSLSLSRAFKRRSADAHTKERNDSSEIILLWRKRGLVCSRYHLFEYFPSLFYYLARAYYLWADSLSLYLFLGYMEGRTGGFRHSLAWSSRHSLPLSALAGDNYKCQRFSPVSPSIGPLLGMRADRLHTHTHARALALVLVLLCTLARSASMMMMIDERARAHVALTNCRYRARARTLTSRERGAASGAALASVRR